MAALGWLMNLHMAGGGAYVPPVNLPAGGFNQANTREGIHVKPIEKPTEGA